MARRGRRPTFGKNITASLKFDQASLRQLEQALLELTKAADPEAIDEALMAGAQVVQKAQIRLAPGPHIGIELIKNVKSVLKGSASKAIKANISSDGRHVAIGPKKKVWYYQFHETGVKPHGVIKRKRTRKKQDAVRYKALKITLTRRQKIARPMMSWMQNGKRVFAKQVRGFAKEPFVAPSVNDNQSEINAAMADVLRRKILKAITG